MPSDSDQSQFLETMQFQKLLSQADAEFVDKAAERLRDGAEKYGPHKFLTADTLDEATALGLDTLIVGEGPHWTAVAAPELGLVIIYAGHYATETLGVRALGEHVSQTFGIPWTFIDAPTGT